MRRFEIAVRRLLPLVAVVAGAQAAAVEPTPQRYSAPIEIGQPAPFVQLSLPAAVYARSMQPDLRDLRVVDANFGRVPFALIAPPAAPAASERLREATLYPLPPRPSNGSAWPSPVEVTVQGDRISVHRQGGRAAEPDSFPAASPGWLVDLGEARPGEAAPRRLRLRWSGPAEFATAYALETSDDLRAWRSAAGGQLMALQSASGVLSQPLVVLPDVPGRFLRLVWLDLGSAPTLTGATALAPAPEWAAADAGSELVFAPSAEPAGRTGSDADARRALHFDLGGELPVVDFDLRFAAGTRVAPVRLQGRSRADEPWHELGAGVFYRLERGGAVAESPAIALPVHARFIRVIADERAAALDPAQTQLVIHARLASLVFAASGSPPFRLLAGSPDAPTGALPTATLVPHLEEERSRFGSAKVGAFSEDADVARAAEQAERKARLLPWLLWSVLVVGVVALAVLVWRLAQGGAGTPPPPIA